MIPACPQACFHHKGKVLARGDKVWVTSGMEKPAVECKTREAQTLPIEMAGSGFRLPMTLIMRVMQVAGH